MGGGAICRVAAVQFARDDKLALKEVLTYTRGKVFGGFFLAPCIPIVFILLAIALLMFGGALLRLPIIGDLVGGLVFFLALFGGFIITVLLMGLVVGGSLLWPAIAAEGSDAFDAFSRSLSYPLSKPWKAILYGFIATVLGAICWLVANLFTFWGLTITRTVVKFGTSPFGWWSRGADGEAVSKLELLWPPAGPSSLHAWPDWQQLAWYEHFSAFLIGIYVLLVVGLLWSFLASFYFCGSTVIYFLLRRDVDGTDLEDLYEEGEQAAEGTLRSQAPAVSPSEPSTSQTSEADTDAAPSTQSGVGAASESSTASSTESSSPSGTPTRES